jgi:hypothetical protein
MYPQELVMVNVYDFQEMLQAGCQSKNPRNLYEGVVLRSLLHRPDVSTSVLGSSWCKSFILYSG